jgi:hypothetical protein
MEQDYLLKRLQPDLGRSIYRAAYSRAMRESIADAVQQAEVVIRSDDRSLAIALQRFLPGDATIQGLTDRIQG